MKRNLKFIIFLILLLIAAYAIESSMPRKYVWNPTFDKSDKEPFGCFVFDDVVSSSLKNGYSVNDSSLFMFRNDSTSGKKSILSIAEYQNLSTNDVNILLRMVEDGNNIMLVASYFNFQLLDFFYLEDSYSHINSYFFKDGFSQNSLYKDSLIIENSKFIRKIYKFYPQICNEYFINDEEYGKIVEVDEFPSGISTKHKDFIINKLAKNTEEEATAIEIEFGEGKLYLVSNPLIFTNYGILDHDNAGYIFSLLSYIDDLPVIRTEAYNSNPNMETGDTSLRYFISQKPLQWALYMSLICIVLFMIFTAKRQQRIIPIIKSPENKSIEFAKLIGTLYFQQKNYKDLVQKKYIYFVEQIKKYTYIDIESEELNIELCKKLSEKTGISAEKIYKLISEIKYSTNKGSIDEVLMKNYISRMNEVLDKIR